MLSSLLNEETRTDINDDRNDDSGFNDDNGDNNGCEERRVRMKSGRIKTFISGSTKHHKRDQQILVQAQKESTSSRNCSGDVYSALGGTLEEMASQAAQKPIWQSRLNYMPVRLRTPNQCLTVFTVYLRKGSPTADQLHPDPTNGICP